MKKVTKTTNSTKKPSLVVDFTNQDNVNNPKLAFISAKINQGKSLTENDINAMLEQMKQYVINRLFDDCNSLILKNGNILKYKIVEAIKKQPWYKRLWNWITRKK